MLIPTLFFGILMLVQPGIVLYDRIIMQQAAADGCRLLETLEPGKEHYAETVVKRHLSGVPDTDVFHAGSWDVKLSGSEGDATVTVTIVNRLRPLPLIGAGMGLLGLADGGLYEFSVESSLSKDEWVAESKEGLSPGAWVQRWEEKA